MIHLFYDGKLVDGFFNTINDIDFMEVSMIHLGLDPLRCDWVEMESNVNGHNPRIMDGFKCDWIVDELVPTAIIVDPIEIPTIKNKFYKMNVYKMLLRILNKQNEILESNFMEPAEIPPVADELITQTAVENKTVMNPMKSMSPTEQDFIFKKGERLKTYSGETATPPKFNSLKEMAIFLLSRKTKWNGEFLDKLNKLKDS